MNYMKTNIVLIQEHGFSLEELENMMPWERLVYVDIIMQKLRDDAVAKHDRMKTEKDMRSLMGRL